MWRFLSRTECVCTKQQEKENCLSVNAVRFDLVILS